MIIGETHGAPKSRYDILKYEPSGSIHSTFLYKCFFDPSAKVLCYSYYLLGMRVTSARLIDPMKLTAHLSNICSTCTGCNQSSSRCDCLPTLWHKLHPLAYSFTSLKTIDHHSLACENFLAVDFIVKWPLATPEWHFHSTSCLSWWRKHQHNMWSRPNLYSFPLID